jgi:hypothetical protein
MGPGSHPLRGENSANARTQVSKVRNLGHPRTARSARWIRRCSRPAHVRFKHRTQVSKCETWGTRAPRGTKCATDFLRAPVLHTFQSKQRARFQSAKSGVPRALRGMQGYSGGRWCSMVLRKRAIRRRPALFAPVRMPPQGRESIQTRSPVDLSMTVRKAFRGLRGR